MLLTKETCTYMNFFKDNDVFLIVGKYTFVTSFTDPVGHATFCINIGYSKGYFITYFN